MKLKELIEHYSDRALPAPAYPTLCALRHLEQVEPCRLVVKCNGICVAAFFNKIHAEDFARLGRRWTPAAHPITVDPITRDGKN